MCTILMDARSYHKETNTEICSEYLNKIIFHMTEHQDKLGEKNGGVFFKLKQQTCYSVTLCVVEVQIQM